MSHTRRNGVASHRWIQTGERDRLAACMSGKNEKQTAVPTMRLSHSRPCHEGTGRLRHGFTPPWGSGAPLGGPGTRRVSAIHRCGNPGELGQRDGVDGDVGAGALSGVESQPGIRRRGCLGPGDPAAPLRGADPVLLRCHHSRRCHRLHAGLTRLRPCRNCFTLDTGTPPPGRPARRRAQQPAFRRLRTCVC